MKRPFYNTTNLSGSALKDAVQRASSQDEAILTYLLNKGEPFSASELFNKMLEAGKKWPLTSIRRSLSTLSATKTKNDSCRIPDLVKTDIMIEGMYGELEHKYAIYKPKFQQATQQSQPITLFKNDAA